MQKINSLMFVSLQFATPKTSALKDSDLGMKPCWKNANEHLFSFFFFFFNFRSHSQSHRAAFPAKTQHLNLSLMFVMHVNIQGEIRF